MIDSNEKNIKQDKSLSEVFAELQKNRYGNNSTQQENHKKQKVKKSHCNIKEFVFSSIGRFLKNIKQISWKEFVKDIWNKIRYKKWRKKDIIKASCIVATAFVVSIVAISTNYILASDEKEQQESVMQAFEENDSTIELNNIITQNANNVKTKQVVIETRDIEFTTERRQNETIPAGEEKVVQQGKKGKEEVHLVRTYENDVMTEEKVTSSTVLEEPLKKIVEVGKSDFLASNGVHIGDYMYVKSEVSMHEKASKNAKEVGKLKKNVKVKLLEANNKWCKVDYLGQEGYIESSTLGTTSSETTNTNNIQSNTTNQDAILDPNFSMPLNRPSGLTLNDFKKVLSNNPNDIYKIFEKNAHVFYEVEQKYQINGIFLASVGIHESNWGTSRISREKKNLFGYGSFDRDPYNLSYDFDGYAAGIELVARALVKNYINVQGTEVYDDQTANASYYYGPTLSGINVKYASDPNWADKVYKHMKYLYDRL